MIFDEAKDLPSGGEQSEKLFTIPELRLKASSGKFGLMSKASPYETEDGFKYYLRGENPGEGKSVTVLAGHIIICGVGFRVAGEAFGSDKKKIASFTSNLGRDSRTDTIAVFEKFVKGAKPLVTGNYKEDIKPFLEKNKHVTAGYRFVSQVLICTKDGGIHSTEIAVTKTLENAMLKSLQKSTGKKPAKGAMFNLCEHANSFWAFSFKDWELVSDEGATATGGDVRFAPILIAGKLSEKTGGEGADIYARAIPFAKAVTDYYQRGQTFARERVDMELRQPKPETRPSKFDDMKDPIPTQREKNKDFWNLEPGEDLPF